MQIHQCTSCNKDSTGGGSIVYGGVFFKLCKDCLDDEEIIRKMNEYWMKGEEESSEK